MQIPLQITIRDMAHSDALDARIREKVAALERLQPRITSCRVTVGEASRRPDRQYEVHVDVRIPGHGEIVATRPHAHDVYVALRDAFDAVTRQLEEASHAEGKSRKASGSPA